MTNDDIINEATALVTAGVNDEKRILADIINESKHLPGVTACLVSMCVTLLEGIADGDHKGRSAVQVWTEISMAVAGKQS